MKKFRWVKGSDPNARLRRRVFMKVVNFVVCMVMLMIFSLPVAFAASENVWIQNILNGDENEPFTKETNEQHLEEADAYIQQGSLNPVICYLRGGFGFGRQYFYHTDLLKEGKPYLLNAPENQDLIKGYQSYYRKALDLDDAPDSPVHLTADMLNAMGSDVLAPLDIRERTARKIMSRYKAGDPDFQMDGFAYNTYLFLLSSCIDHKDYNKYLTIVNEMIDEFGSNDELEMYKIQAEAVITGQASE